MAANKRFWSYEQVHEICKNAVERGIFQQWRPTLIICIAAGGFLPTRILRSFLKNKYGVNIPIQTIGLQLYDVEGCDPSTSPVQREQWLSYGTGPGQVLLQGHRILLVDEVDDSRKTLAHVVSELQSDIASEKQQHLHQVAAADSSRMAAAVQPWHPPEIGAFVVQNKLRPKLAQLPEEIMKQRYWAGMEIENCWCVYPWDADDIYHHTQTAETAAAAAAEGKSQQHMQAAEIAAETAANCMFQQHQHQHQQQQQQPTNRYHVSLSAARAPQQEAAASMAE